MSNDKVSDVVNFGEETIETADLGARKYDKPIKQNEENLDLDVKQLDVKISSIQKYIIDLDTQMNNLRTIITNERDPGKKGKLYGVLNDSMKTLAIYEDLYLRAMDIKFKYRKESNEFILKKIRILEVDLRKLEDDSAAGLGTAQLVKMIGELQQEFNSLSANTSTPSSDNKSKEKKPSIVNQTISIEEDPDLRL